MTQITEYAYRLLSSSRWTNAEQATWECIGMCDAEDYDGMIRQCNEYTDKYGLGMLLMEGYKGKRIVEYSTPHNYPQ
jgi:hypothetical protein